MGRHVIEAMGMTRVVIEDGKVVEVGEPQVDFCPLFAKFRNIQHITPEVVKDNIEFRIRDFGMCSASRNFRMKDFLSFGVSELLGTAIDQGMLDCAVIVCEGAGTVIISEPELVQGIGGRVSGLVSTTIIPEIVAALGEDAVLDARNGTIDQVEGVGKAYRLGYRNVGVTVCSADDAERIRARFSQRVGIFAVHTTGRTREEAEALISNCDVVTACASKHIREVARERRAFQVGNKIPVFGTSLWGETLLKKRLEITKVENVTSPEQPPRPLI